MTRIKELQELTKIKREEIKNARESRWQELRGKGVLDTLLEDFEKRAEENIAKGKFTASIPFEDYGFRYGDALDIINYMKKMGYNCVAQSSSFLEFMW